MARLRFLKSAGEEAVLNLKEGSNRLGRTPDNDFQVEDGSVSSHHCDIRVSAEGVWVRDLGSTNGTFVNGQRVNEGWLRDGQVLRLGQVELMVEDAVEVEVATEVPAAAGVEIPIPPPVPLGVATEGELTDACVHHPSTSAQYICTSCEQLFCVSCLKTLRAGMNTFYSCPDCGKTVVRLNEYRRQNERAGRSFFQMIPGAFVYPFRDSGAVILVSGAIFFSLLEWGQNIAKYAMFIGAIGIILMTIISGGYFFAFMKSVAGSAATGEDKPVRWPDVLGFAETFLSPFFQVLAIGLVCVGPGVAAMIFVSPILGIGLLVGGVFCLPMAMLTVTLTDSVAGLNPMVVVPSVFKVFGPYVAICGVFVVTLGLVWGVEAGLELTGIGPLAAPAVNFMSLYAAVVQMRLLGLMYFKYKERLGWFSRNR